MKEKTGTSASRRTFIKGSLATLATFSIVPRHVLGKGFIAPSDQLTKAIVGTGSMGRGHIPYAGTKVVALCDVDKKHLDIAVGMVDKGVKTFSDYREVIQLPEVDIVHVATPPHWHGIIAADAARAGKDVWCEKPMTRTIGEGKRLVEAVQQHGRIFRLNTWFRFQDNFYGMRTPVKPIKKLVQSGLLGWPLKVTVSKHTGFDWKFYWVGNTNNVPQPVPAELDYEMWLGPAPYKPYSEHRVHQTFRGYWDYDGGGLGDMGQHYIDPIQYFLGKDDTSPVSVEVDAPQQHTEAVGTWRRITYTYADGCQIVLDGEAKDEKVAYIEGPKGKLFPNFQSDIPDLEKKLAAFPDPEPQVTDFVDAVKNRKKFALNEENGHRSCTIVNMGLAALRLGRSLKFDPEKQEFIDDEGANRLINQPMRGPWTI
ncbi:MULTISPECIES: Gfo/Idh/MocA family oxidoreductase [Dyadobacter]|uniref:Gfo/Idh/MocA family oxidoreductase n=2 Tax=Dyadobacter TaxID=120831 RepID=A0A9X1PG05_9BACT|nr:MULTISPECIES: Gfo/Idh/MocA family oxidoreductase [Dyadobacter]MCF0043120.1 Gfo/Idh/MocA family oxidoreductase [Dyadobacter fanqingshengii]MCF0043198.1 Gfo/Idh/MocA family oxidoreductase [Dyadobacter fanqingshengii]MCF2506786.1 Gfo/Idh/MocA family oxidoreductase [Dyadobacter fanqingshengii]USJ35673.1 Gfo/Idh/MocA family oxidoreductase [Dyadobacter fanqingshengii]SKC00535.1 Predicted dehydrogenase [Dyadobacter psychrophilus]